MTTSVAISDEVHRVVLEKQMKIFQSKGRKPKINQIIEQSIMKGVDLIEE
jgi:hypothetical protein